MEQHTGMWHRTEQLEMKLEKLKREIRDFSDASMRERKTVAEMFAASCSMNHETTNFSVSPNYEECMYQPLSDPCHFCIYKKEEEIRFARLYYYSLSF